MSWGAAEATEQVNEQSLSYTQGSQGVLSCVTCAGRGCLVLCNLAAGSSCRQVELDRLGRLSSTVSFHRACHLGRELTRTSLVLFRCNTAESITACILFATNPEEWVMFKRSVILKRLLETRCSRCVPYLASYVLFPCLFACVSPLTLCLCLPPQGWENRGAERWPPTGEYDFLFPL